MLLQMSTESDRSTPLDVTANESAYVYFVASAGLIKIGATVYLEQRISQLAGQSAAPQRLVGAVTVPSSDAAYKLEALLHQRYAAVRRHGEWFELTEDEALACIRDMQAANPERSAVTDTSLMTIREAAALCSVDYDTFLRWVRKGVLKHYTVGPHKSIRVRRCDVAPLVPKA